MKSYQTKSPCKRIASHRIAFQLSTKTQATKTASRTRSSRVPPSSADSSNRRSQRLPETKGSGSKTGMLGCLAATFRGSRDPHMRHACAYTSSYRRRRRRKAFVDETTRIRRKRGRRRRRRRRRWRRRRRSLPTSEASERVSNKRKTDT